MNWVQAFFVAAAFGFIAPPLLFIEDIDGFLDYLWISTRLTAGALVVYTVVVVGLPWAKPHFLAFWGWMGAF